VHTGMAGAPRLRLRRPLTGSSRSAAPYLRRWQPGMLTRRAPTRAEAARDVCVQWVGPGCRGPALETPPSCMPVRAFVHASAGHELSRRLMLPARPPRCHSALQFDRPSDISSAVALQGAAHERAPQWSAACATSAISLPYTLAFFAR
jgi:hypothetical protein